MGQRKPKQDLTAGDILVYPYLWGWQSQRGDAFGQFLRPCVVLFRSDRKRDGDLIICPITSQQIRPPRKALDLEIPDRRAAGLKPTKPSRIVLSECNIDNVHESIHLLSTSGGGALPAQTLERAQKMILDQIRNDLISPIKREQNLKRQRWARKGVDVMCKETDLNASAAPDKQDRYHDAEKPQM